MGAKGYAKNLPLSCRRRLKSSLIKNILAPTDADPSGSWNTCNMDTNYCPSPQIRIIQGSALAAQLTASKLFFQWVLMRLNLKGLKLLICFNKELNLLNLFNSFNRRLNLKGLKLLICFNRELNLLNLSSTARFRFSLFTGGFVVVLKPADGILGVGLPTVNADGVMVYSVNN
ncbi:hypothetical protein LINGRAHAP2_LOCUS27623 [Linum grandiflorum]